MNRKVLDIEPDAPIAIVVDAGYDASHLAYQLRDLLVVVIGQFRSDRVLCGIVFRAKPPRIEDLCPRGRSRLRCCDEREGPPGHHLILAAAVSGHAPFGFGR